MVSLAVHVLFAGAGLFGHLLTRVGQQREVQPELVRGNLAWLSTSSGLTPKT